VTCDDRRPKTFTIPVSRVLLSPDREADVSRDAVKGWSGLFCDGTPTFAWLNRNRRLAKDFEATIASATTWLYVASVKLMSRRLAAA
jgi:transposase